MTKVMSILLHSQWYGKLYNEIIAEYEKAKDKSNEKARENAEQNHGNPDREKKDTPFR